MVMILLQSRLLTSMSNFIDMIAVSIEEAELSPKNNKVTPDWAEIFTTSHQYHLIESGML